MNIDAFQAEVHQALGHDRIQEQWNALGGKLRRRWRKLKWQDVLRPDGDTEYLVALLEERYGVDRREALLQVFEFEVGLL